MKSKVQAEVPYEIVSEGQPFKGEALVWCESGPMKPNQRGTWGVNPPSVFRKPLNAS
jgi:hypothetical protein